MTAVFHHSAQHTLLILVIWLTLLLGSPPAARADEPAQRTVVVMPFTPPAGEETDGLGAALQNIAENTLVLHPEVREIYFLNVIEQLFPTREHALQWLAGKADLPREALKKAKVDAVLYGSLTQVKGQPAVQARWRNLASGEEYSATLPVDIASGLHQFRLKLFALQQEAGLPMPTAQQAKALYKEQTSLAALQAHGKDYQRDAKHAVRAKTARPKCVAIGNRVAFRRIGKTAFLPIRDVKVQDGLLHHPAILTTF